MPDDPPPAGRATHEVANQPPPLAGHNLYDGDRALKDAVAANGADWADERLSRFGATLARPEVIELGFEANRHTPELRSHDRAGHRIDQVAFHPAWHELMALGRGALIHSLPWREPRPGAHVARAALAFLMNQVESGVCCPFSMTYAAVPVLRRQPELAALWEPKLTDPGYDPRPLPLAQKGAATIGMAMTEKQGGSDLRANSTLAEPVGASGPGALYRLTGHKWFCSAPMSDAFLTLAQAPGGLSCFLLARWLPDGTANRFLIQRLKDKLGNRSNASSEVEYDGALATMVGEEGRGIPTILEMVQYTRLDVSLCSAALMRQALAQALHHAAHRRAFQKRLIDHALMRRVLADLALESEAATAFVLRLAHAVDRADVDPQERAYTRVATAIAKYWIAKRAPGFLFEAMECLGGNGYIEDSILPRLYREAPLSSIWEGCGNVISLDILRALASAPECGQALQAELAAAKGLDGDLDRAIGELEDALARPGALEPRGRWLAERLALCLQAALLLQSGQASLANAFCRTRLGGTGGALYGTLPDDVALDPILARAMPGRESEAAL